MGWGFGDTVCAELKPTRVVCRDNGFFQWIGLKEEEGNGMGDLETTDAGLKPTRVVCRDNGVDQWIGLKEEGKGNWIWQDGTTPVFTKWTTESKYSGCSFGSV